jgi:multiple sugar transport system permease protein
MDSSYPMELPKRKLSHSTPSAWRVRLGKQLIAYLFLLPALLAFGLFAWYPIVKAIIMSFHEVTLKGDMTFVGFEKFELMFRDPVFSIAWRNSLDFALWSLLLGFVIPIVIAVLVREMRIAQGFFRIVYFLPTVVPGAVAIIIWRLIYNGDTGVLNQALASIGIEGPNWLGDIATVKPAIIAMLTWSGFGSTALIYLSTLQEIPMELYEAAELDGATPFARIRAITLPHLYPVMSSLFILQILSVVQVFTEPFLLTKGGPGRETITPAMYIYQRAFIRTDLGYAAAWSVTVILILLVVSIIYRTINHRLELD